MHRLQNGKLNKSRPMENTTAIIADIICAQPFWKDLNPQFLHVIKECSDCVTFGIGQPIFQAGFEAEHLYLITRGYVSLEMFMPGKGVITIQTIGPGEALGWSWFFPPYRWHFNAKSRDITEAVVFDACKLREYAAENHDFGYDLASRVGQVMLERLQATRERLVEYHAAIKD
jgi:CRP/FNR family cyclic AMP-dependent transcriptional regulator